MHPVDVDAVADAGAGVAGEVEVGHRVGDEGIVVLNEVHEEVASLVATSLRLMPAISLGDHLLGGHIQKIACHGRAQALAWILLMFRKSFTSWIWRAGSAMALATSST